MEVIPEESQEEATSSINRSATKNYLDYLKSFKIYNTYFNNEKSQPLRKFSKFKRKLIFFLLFITNIIINFDHGAIPAATTEIKAEMKINNVKLGSLGSLVFFGLTLGSAFAGIAFNNYASKWIVTFSLAFEVVFIWLFCTSESIIELNIYRFGSGFFQVFCYIYFPVWVDQYGITDSKSMWLTYLQLGVPLGTMLGYVFTGFSIQYFKQVIK